MNEPLSVKCGISYNVLKSLSTLQSFHLFNCPIPLIHFPPQLTASLHSFTYINSPRKNSGVALSRLANLTDLTVSNVPVKASGPYVVLAHMKKLKTLTISHANLTGYLPKYIHSNLTYIDFSGNQLKGNIPTSITMLDSLESLNLSSNGFKGEIPSSLGDLLSLKNLSLASNSFSGSIPNSNQLNGTIPKFISEMRILKYLNLANNSLRGVVPFNSTFIKRLAMFKVGGNSNLCYNHSVFSSKLKLEIAPCDKFGMPMSPPPANDSYVDDSSDSDYGYSDDDCSGVGQDPSYFGQHRVQSIPGHVIDPVFRSNLAEYIASIRAVEDIDVTQDSVCITLPIRHRRSNQRATTPYQGSLS